MERVLILNGGYLARSPSGGDRHLLALAAALGEHPEVESAILYAPELARDWLPEGAAAWIYPGGVPGSTASAVAAYMARVARVIRRIAASRSSGEPPATVVLASPSPVDLVPAFWHRLLFGSRIVAFAFHVGDSAAAGRPRRGVQALISRLAGWPAGRLLLRVDRVVTSTTEVRRQLLELGVREERL
ncbi:MAG: hypothetical protein AAF725_26405, partial [Acidobacteriota bacterium]